MKKYLLTFFSLATVLALLSCGSTPTAEPEPEPEPPKQEEVAPVVEEEVVTPVKENVSVNFLDINYSNVSDFYNQIIALRTNDINFAKYFQC